MSKSFRIRVPRLAAPGKYDVIVAGGGPSGIAAAIAAARAGAKVAIIESLGNFGGMATSGMVPGFNPFSNGKIPVIRGIGLEVLKELHRRGGTVRKPHPMPRELAQYDWCGIDVEKLKRCRDQRII